MAARPAKPAVHAAAPVELPLAEAVCLALVDEGIDHGWAIGTELGPDADVGRVWSLSRPLTYRAIEQLTTKGLVARASETRGSSRERSILSLTADASAFVQAWLATPVAHLRDVRTELLVKLVLRRRRGLTLEPLIEAQQRAFQAHFEILTTVGPDADVVELWRRESARAIRRFLDVALEQATSAPAPRAQPVLRLSARNQLAARVVSITHGEVMSTVKAVLPSGQFVTAVITKESVLDLDLAPDDEVLVIVKSTEVMLAKP